MSSSPWKTQPLRIARKDASPAYPGKLSVENRRFFMSPVVLLPHSLSIYQGPFVGVGVGIVLWWEEMSQNPPASPPSHKRKHQDLRGTLFPSNLRLLPNRPWGLLCPTDFQRANPVIPEAPGGMIHDSHHCSFHCWVSCLHILFPQGFKMTQWGMWAGQGLGACVTLTAGHAQVPQESPWTLSSGDSSRLLLHLSPPPRITLRP